MNNKKGLIVIITLFVIVLAFILVLVFKNINKENYLIDISYNELKEKIDNEETFVLYIGKEGCSACEDFNPKFKSIINKYKIKTYYLDLAKYSDEEEKYVVKNISFSGTPTVLFMINGKDSLNSDTKIVGNISEDKIITKLKNRGYIK